MSPTEAITASQKVQEQLDAETPPWESFVVDGQIEVAYKFELLPLDKLVVDYHEDVLNGGGPLPTKTLAYQRKQEKISRRIIRDGVNPDLFGVLIVNRRDDDEGFYAIVDGGTRWHALIKLGVPSETLIPCLVFDWDDNREIRNFVHLNRERSGLTQVDIFVAEVKYGDPVATEIQRILIEETGAGVGYGKDGWQAVAALRQAYKYRLLANELRMMRELGWLAMPGGRTQNTVGALTRLFRLPNFDVPTATEKWKALTPHGLVQEAKVQKDIAGASRGIARLVAMQLGGIYNKGMGARRRLDLNDLSPRVAEDEDDD